ncbi:MAG: Zn-ribbon domain-containing OB-fold protein [Chloroflexi bacterium]|nr:Zn-ribbon domain-containing OB-fold protein [Chloroflexota bacterium]
MAEYLKPLPTMAPETAGFWEAARRHQLVIQRCARCWRMQHPPRAVCAACGHTEYEWVPSAGKGQVYSLTRVYQNRAPGWADEVPYVFAIIQLNEGIHLISNVVGVPAEQVHIGTPVEVFFEDVTEEISLPKFRVAQE